MIRKITLTLLTLTLCSALTAASTWEIDPVHSDVSFKVKHLMISNVRGAFQSFSGTLNFDAEDPTKSSVEVSIDVASISTGNEQRDTHLKSAEFFNVEQHPKMTFVSKHIDKTEGGLKLRGDLTLHGVTREVVLIVEGPTPPQTDPWGGVRIGATATTKINRSDFGLTYNAALETGGVVIGDEVQITIEVEFLKK